MTMTPQAGAYVAESARKYHLERDLNDWWIQQAQVEVERTVPKAIEYGATDLIDIGHNMIVSGVKGPVNHDIPMEEWEAELGIYFYMVGKMARWRDAIQRGDRVSDDTLFDIGVYIRMVQRIRQCGGWPGQALKTNHAPNPGLTSPTGEPWRNCCPTQVSQYHLETCPNWVPARVRDKDSVVRVHHDGCILGTDHSGDCVIAGEFVDVKEDGDDISHQFD